MPGCDSGVVVCSSLLLSRGHPGRRQAENPLIPMCSFARPPLSSPRQTSPATPLKRSNLSNGWFLNRHAQQIAGVPLAWFVTALYTCGASVTTMCKSALKCRKRQCSAYLRNSTSYPLARQEKARQHTHRRHSTRRLGGSSTRGPPWRATRTGRLLLFHGLFARCLPLQGTAPPSPGKRRPPLAA